MDIFEIKKRIEDLYKKGRYDRVLSYIEKYMSDENNGIYDVLVSMYIETLIRLEHFDEAYLLIIKAKKIWPYLYTLNDLVDKFIMCDKIKEAEEILEENKDNLLLINHCAYSYLLYEKFDLSEKWFNYFMSKSDEEEYINKSKSFLDKIKRHVNEGSFIEINYLKYKRNGGYLHPGQIIYTDKVYQIEDCVEDYKKCSMPYLIYKVEGPMIYAFPITKVKETTKEYVYRIKSKDYPNFEFDRFAKDNFAIIFENNVGKVIDELRIQDYKNVINNLYVSYCMTRRKDKFGEFFDEYYDSMDIDVYDIVYSNKEDSGYFVIIKKLEDSYLGLKVLKENEQFIIDTTNVVNLTREDFMFKIYMTLDNYLKIKNETIKVLEKRR